MNTNAIKIPYMCTIFRNIKTKRSQYIMHTVHVLCNAYYILIQYIGTYCILCIYSIYAI